LFGGKKLVKSHTSSVFFLVENHQISLNFLSGNFVSLDLKFKKKRIFELKADDDELHHKNWRKKKKRKKETPLLTTL
jgi:hypothetical protein